MKTTGRLTICLLALLATAVAGLYLAFSTLPPIGDPPVEFDGPDDQGPNRNWFGQTGWWLLGHAILLLLAVYSAKWLILRAGRSRAEAAGWYGLVLLATLPYFWFFIEPDWYNAHVFRIACWLDGPFAILLVPSVSMLLDLQSADPPSGSLYVSRSAVELVLIPVWVYFWAFFSFFCLGWGWI